MTFTNDELDGLIRACMDSGITATLVPAETAQQMRARLDRLTGHRPGGDHEADCLMCAVRALTEGDPAATWTPETEGAAISGVVLRMGTLATDFGSILFVDLWTGGTGRVRIKAYGVSLRHAIDGVAPQIGDRLAVWFDGEGEIPSGRLKGRPYKRYSANVQRGH